jgi:hypothetical protein
MSNSCILSALSCIVGCTSCGPNVIFLNQIKWYLKGGSSDQSGVAFHLKWFDQVRPALCGRFENPDRAHFELGGSRWHGSFLMEAFMQVVESRTSKSSIHSARRGSVPATHISPSSKAAMHGANTGTRARCRTFDERPERLLGCVTMRGTFRWRANAVMPVDFNDDCLTAVVFHREDAEKVATNLFVPFSIPFSCEKSSEARIGTRSMDGN